MALNRIICKYSKNEKMVAMWKDSTHKKLVIVTTTKFKI